MDSSVHAVIISRYIQDRIDEANAARAREARSSNTSRHRRSQRDAVRLAEPRRRWSPAGARRERSGQPAA
jgi:hypothetical protein